MENPSQTNGYLKDETEELGPSPYTRAYPATYPAPAPPPSGTPRRSRTAGTPRRGFKLQRVWTAVYSNLNLSRCNCRCHFHRISNCWFFHWNGRIIKTKIVNLCSTPFGIHYLFAVIAKSSKVVKLVWNGNNAMVTVSLRSLFRHCKFIQNVKKSFAGVCLHRKWVNYFWFDMKYSLNCAYIY